tara:strand:+ start:2829 stop:3086 length:258 start_codon:yes stop_codon:yes gene_type:complete
MLNNLEQIYETSEGQIIKFDYKVKPINRVYEKTWRPQLHHINIISIDDEVSINSIDKRKYAKEILQDILISNGIIKVEKQERKFW